MIYLVIALPILKHALISQDDFNNPGKGLCILSDLISTSITIFKIGHIFLATQSFFKFVLFGAAPRIKQLTILCPESGRRVLNYRDKGVEVVGHVEVQRHQQVR